METGDRLIQLQTRPRPQRYSAELTPYPSGWYCVGFSDELAPGAVLTHRLAGQDIVVFRTKSGAPAAVDAYCTHMGAHLGHGGTVEGETIRCPFHGFCFDAAGVCTKTGYGTKPPPKARQRTWPLIERHGAMFVFFDPLGRPPTWEIPEVDTSGWTRLRHRSMRLRSHPQEIAENSVDIGHFVHIHGYDDVKQLTPLRTEGAHLTVRYAFRRRRPGLFSFRDISVEFEIEQHGLGCALVEARTSVGMRSRQMVLVTPLADDEVQLRIANCIRRADSGERWWLLSLIPTRWLAALAFKEFANDVTQDLAIWNNKRYITPPALAVGDGPVGAYRKWARQFHGEEPKPPPASVDPPSAPEAFAPV